MDERTPAELIDSMIAGNASPAVRQLIQKTLQTVPIEALRICADAKIRIRKLDNAKRELYADASPMLKKLGINVDGWPEPPAGLFVVDERTLYLKKSSAMTIAHEFGHALDCAIGGGVYASGMDAQLRDGFATAHDFVTPYAATGLDEWFAEGFRAYIGANDKSSHWPNVSKERLERMAPQLLSFLDTTFSELRKEHEKAARTLVAVPDLARSETAAEAPRRESSNEKRNEFYRELTKDLIAVLESGDAKKVSDKLWRATAAGVPFNPTTQAPYTGINTLNLIVNNLHRGYTDPRYMTVKQANKRGWAVRAGEHGARIEVWKFVDRYRDAEGRQLSAEEAKKALADPELAKTLVPFKVGTCNLYTVFNVEQIDVKQKLPNDEIVKRPFTEVFPLPLKTAQREWELHERADQLIAALGVPVRHDGGDQAYYVPQTDVIHLPPQNAFPSQSNYYDVLLHEAGHSAGHESRLNRPMLQNYSKAERERAREELRAELTSLFLAAEVGLPHNMERHADYVGSWAQILRDSHMEIFDAARDAQAAKDFLLQKEREYLQERAPELEQKISALNVGHTELDEFGRAVIGTVVATATRKAIEYTRVHADYLPSGSHEILPGEYPVIAELDGDKVARTFVDVSYLYGTDPGDGLPLENVEDTYRINMSVADFLRRADNPPEGHARVVLSKGIERRGELLIVSALREQNKVSALDLTGGERQTRFLEKVQSLGGDRGRIWSATMNEIKALKADYDVTTVRRMLTSYRGALVKLDPNNAAIEMLRASTADQRQINGETRANVMERLKALRPIDPEHVAETALRLLASDNVAAAAAGVVLATGRRLPEVFKGSFKAVNETYIAFDGAIKGRDHLMLPSLVDTAFVISAIDRIRNATIEASRDELENKAINGTYQKPTTKALRDELGGDLRDVTLEDARSLYATVAVEWYGSPSVALTAFQAEILGHSPDGSVSALTKCRFYPIGKELEWCERLEHSRLDLIARASNRANDPELSAAGRAAIKQELEELRAASFDTRAPATRQPTLVRGDTWFEYFGAVTTRPDVAEHRELPYDPHYDDRQVDDDDGKRAKFVLRKEDHERWPELADAVTVHVRHDLDGWSHVDARDSAGLTILSDDDYVRGLDGRLVLHEVAKQPEMSYFVAYAGTGAETRVVSDAQLRLLAQNSRIPIFVSQPFAERVAAEQAAATLGAKPAGFREIHTAADVDVALHDVAASLLIETARDTTLSAGGAGTGIGSSRHEAGANGRSAPALQAQSPREVTPMRKGILIGYPGRHTLNETQKGPLLKLGLKQTFGKGNDRTEKWFDISAKDEVAKKLDEALKNLQKGQMLKVNVDLGRGSYKGRDDQKWRETVELPISDFAVIDKLEKGQKINDFTISGKILDDVKLEKTKAGKDRVEINVEVEGLKNGKDDRVRVKFFDAAAREAAEKYHKGGTIEVPGRLDIDEYDRDGAKQKRPEIIVSQGKEIEQTRGVEPAGANRAPEQASPAAGKGLYADQPHRLVKENETTLVVEFAKENGEVVRSREVGLVQRAALPYNMSGKIVAESLDGQQIYMELGRNDVLELDKAAFEGRVPNVGDTVEVSRNGDKETALYKDEQRKKSQTKERERDGELELANA